MFKKSTLKEINKRWAQEQPLLRRKEEIRQEKEKLLAKRFKSSTTKRILAFIIINCSLIEIFTGYIMYKQLEISAVSGIGVDMSPQTALIAAVVTEAFSFCVYCYKSMKENTKSGIVFEAAMFDKEMERLNLETENSSNQAHG